MSRATRDSLRDIFGVIGISLTPFVGVTWVAYGIGDGSGTLAVTMTAVTSALLTANRGM